MGLDDFLGQESSTESKSTTTESSQSSESDESVSFDSDIHQKPDPESDKDLRAPIGFGSLEDYEDTRKGEFITHELNTKYWYQMFTHILPEQEYDIGGRYLMKVFKSEDEQRTWEVSTITCVSVSETQLYKIPREVVMMDTGEYRKEEALDTLSDRFGYEVSPKDTVSLHFFTKWRGIVEGAMISSEIEKVNNGTIERLTRAFMHSSEYKYTNQYDRLPNRNNIGKW